MERASPPRSPIPTLSSPPTTVADDVIAMQQAYAVSPAQEAEVVDLSINSPSHQHYRPATDNQQNLRSVREASTGSVLGGSTSEHSDPVGIFSRTAVNEPTRTQEGSATQVTASASQPIPVASSSTEPTASIQHPTSPAPQSVAVAGISGVQLGYSRLEDKRFQCNTCQHLTKTKQNMETHLNTHTGEKPYQCQYCDKSFADPTTKIRHLRTHTGEKPYQCQYCDESFAYLTTKIRHLRTHTGEKPFKCTICYYAAARQGTLKVHMRKKHPSQQTSTDTDQPSAKKPKTE